eukprot:scaffold5641_cov220-Skeletonema_menzelii.AAC.3
MELRVEQGVSYLIEEAFSILSSELACSHHLATQQPAAHRVNGSPVSSDTFTADFHKIQTAEMML